MIYLLKIKTLDKGNGLEIQSSNQGAIKQHLHKHMDYKDAHDLVKDAIDGVQAFWLRGNTAIELQAK